MPSILRDPIWQFVGAAFALLAIVEGIILYRMQHRRKGLSYEVLANTPLLSVQQELRSRIQVLFDGQPVDTVRLVLVRIANSGNVPVAPADYESPIRLSLGPDARVLTAELAEATPADLHFSPIVQGADVVVPPVLLNRGDAVTIRLLAAGAHGRMAVAGRVVGVSRIEDVAARGRTRAKYASWLYLLWVGAFSISLGLNGFGPQADTKSRLAGLFFICTGLMALYYLLRAVQESVAWPFPAPRK